MDAIYLGYKNNFKYQQEKNKKANSVLAKSANNPQGNYSNNVMNRGFGNKNNDKDTAEDYQRLAKKFYSIILSLQDELTKQTVKNYSLLEENMTLKQQISELQKVKNL